MNNVTIPLAISTNAIEVDLFYFFPIVFMQDISEPLRIILRDEWNATPPINETKLELPSIFVIISHTVTPECTVKVRLLQN